MVIVFLSIVEPILISLLNSTHVQLFHSLALTSVSSHKTVRLALMAISFRKEFVYNLMVQPTARHGAFRNPFVPNA
jgi:hypothetical protein